MFGHVETIAGLNGTGAVTNSAAGNAVLTVGATGAGGNFAGTVTRDFGSLSLVKTGAGTQTVGGAVTTTTGTPTVNGGFLLINGTVADTRPR